MDKRIEFLKEVFSRFEEEEIQYCVLRNYEFLFDETVPIESLDTVIAEKDLHRAELVFKEMGFSRRKQQFSLKHKAYFKLINLKKVSFDVQVGGVYWNDMIYIDEKILQNRTKKDCFDFHIYVPSDDDTFVMLLVHSILGKRFFKPKYQKILFSLFPHVDENYVITNISKIFSKRIARNLITAVGNNDFGSINAKKLAAYFVSRKPKNPFIFAALFWRWFLQRKNPFRPAPLVSIVGPDGAGKSTMVKAVNESLLESGRKTSLIYTGRGRDHILPITVMGRKYKSKEKKKDRAKGDVTLSKTTGLRRRLLYTFAAPVFTLDLLLRYYFRILPQRLKKKIVVTDRYCSDIILMKHVPFGVKKLFLRLFPNPTVSILLYNSPEVLNQRRPEESIPELERQMAIFNRLKYSLKVPTENQEKDIGMVREFVLIKLMRSWD